MGLSESALRFLFVARPRLDQTLTIGRQEVSAPRRQIEALFSAHHLDAPPTPDGFAEPLLHAMGARSVDSLDASPFEGATITHDLNRPLGEPDRRFTAVIDGGTLEHVFNVPVAMRNCMELVEPGGDLVMMVPANNEIGHGLYQFCPELFYRALERDFEIAHMLLLERGPRPRWYRIADARSGTGHRIRVRTRWSTYLIVQARRRTEEAIADLTLYQSDYEAAWSGMDPTPRSLQVKLGDRLARLAPALLQGRIGSPAIRRVKF